MIATVGEVVGWALVALIVAAEIAIPLAIAFVAGRHVERRTIDRQRDASHVGAVAKLDGRLAVLEGGRKRRR